LFLGFFLHFSFVLTFSLVFGCILGLKQKEKNPRKKRKDPKIRKDEHINPLMMSL